MSAAAEATGTPHPTPTRRTTYEVLLRPWKAGERVELPGEALDWWKANSQPVRVLADTFVELCALHKEGWTEHAGSERFRDDPTGTLLTMLLHALDKGDQLAEGMDAYYRWQRDRGVSAANTAAHAPEAATPAAPPASAGADYVRGEASIRADIGTVISRMEGLFYPYFAIATATVNKGARWVEEGRSMSDEFAASVVELSAAWRRFENAVTFEDNSHPNAPDATDMWEIVLTQLGPLCTLAAAEGYRMDRDGSPPEGVGDDDVPYACAPLVAAISRLQNDLFRVRAAVAQEGDA